MAAVFNPLGLIKRRPILAILVGIVVGLALLLAFLRYWITTDTGRDFVISQIDGREVAGYGRLSVRNLEGDPLSDFSIGSLEIRDASGEWLNASDIKVTWSPAALLSRTVDLSDLGIAEINVLRRPVRAPRPKTDSEPWEVRLDRGKIDRLLLAEGVAGPQSASGITARFLNERNGSIDAQLEIMPLDGGGDQITAKILRDRQSAFNLEIDGRAPAGGVFAHLMGLPEGSSAIVFATAAGDLKDGRGEARLTIDGSDKVFLSGKIENSGLEASVRLDAGALPIPDTLAQFLGPAVEADITAAFEKKAVDFTIDGTLAAGRVKLSGASLPNRMGLQGPARIEAELTTLAPYWDAVRLLKLDGEISESDGIYSYSGDTQLSVLEGSGLPFESVTGPVTARLEAGRIPFTGDVVVRKLLASNAEAASILGDEMRVSGNGVFNLVSRRLVVDAAEVTHKSGNAQLLGEVGFADSVLNVSGKVTQSIAALPGGFGGSAAGFIQAKGSIRDFELGLNLNLTSVTSNVEALAGLVNGNGSVRGLLRIQPDAGLIRRLDFKLPGVEGQMSGPVYGPRSPDLAITAQQLTSLDVSGNQIDLGAITARLRRSGDSFRLSGSSEGGNAFVSGRNISDLSSDVDLLIDGNDVSGPVRLTGRSDDLPSAVSFSLNRSAKTMRLDAIEGRLGAVEFTGSARLDDEGELDADINVEAGAFEYAGITFGTLKFSGTGGRTGGESVDLGARFEATMVKLTSDLTIDSLTGTLTTTPEGYRFDGRLIDKQEGADSDMAFSGLMSLAGSAPSGTLSLSGSLLGIGIATREDMAWSLGNAPTLDADLALLGGSVQAELRPGDATTSSSLTVKNVGIAPLLAALGLPEIDAVISGKANGRLFGDNPEGTLQMSAKSAVSGLETELDFDMNGRLDKRALALTAQATYGPKLKANAASRIPVKTSATGLVQLDRNRALEALADVNGSLDALRLVALAYGHDIGGTLKSRIELGGSLEEPEVSADVEILDGIYEYGATGMSLKDLDLKAAYDKEILTVAGTGVGSEGGNLRFDGRLAETEAGVTVTLDRILVYDRLGDFARISGNAKLVEGEKDRVLSGALSVNEARFNIDNFTSNTIRTLNVRWTTDDPDARREALLEKPIRLGLKVSSPRGVIVRGRGLDSDWGVNLDVTGQPDNILLNGRATLARGSLELAQRPFEFETGVITFDGPIESARLAISAKREVDGFAVRADVGGSPSRPTIEFSSTPSLPEDEILSRMLFGRSSVDLTALEAAELATSIARLAGQDTGLDPIGTIQSGLGVDRLRFGVDAKGNPELGVGQYLAPDVYLEVTTQGAAGNSVEVEWQPRPQVSVTSETSSTGDSRISVRWKNDY